MSKEEHHCGECEDCECGEEEYEVTEIVLTDEDIDELVNGLRELKTSKKPVELPFDDSSGIVFVHEKSVEEEKE